MRTLVYVIYDSILNSVFQGQVYQPLMKRMADKSISTVYLISFEPITFTEEQIRNIIEPHEKLKVITLKRNTFITASLLFPEIRKLKKQLASLENYEIFARGPLAGLIANRTLEPEKCSHMITQARGLLAEEYKHVHKDKKGIFSFMHHWRTKQYKKVEKLVFKGEQVIKNHKIEVVTDALKDYLVKTYHTNSDKCFLARDDVPAKIDKEKIRSWKFEIREKINIPLDAYVYCFSGAVKSWQCPELVIDFFKKKYEEDSRNFLLVLTFDVDNFKMLLKKLLPKHSYHVTSVSHENIYRFMAAADKGLV